MEKNFPLHLQEVVFGSSQSKISKQISDLEKAGKLRKIAPRIYSPNFTDIPGTIIQRNIFTILGRLYPGALLSHRSALEFKPTSSGHLFITYTYTRKISLPGITLRFMAGPGPIGGDNLLSGELYSAQLERALLENLQVSRKTGAESKTVNQQELEARLEQVARVKGESGINILRDKARTISEKLGMQTEFQKLNKLISALLSSKPSRVLSSPLALARAFGYPYDPARISLFEKLFIALMQNDFNDLPEKNISGKSFRNFSFFEAYFSNYIEGTEFEVEEAKQIIEKNMPIPGRNDDSHDVLGTYKLVSNREEMLLTPDSPEKLLEMLLYRHSVLLSARTSKKPGQFKDKNNRAGDTHFVDHTLVAGTLTKGFDYYMALSDPFSKAAFMMFLISEVHPFLDGNGRIARVMMNAELVKSNQSKIIIPTVYRDDYIGAIRKLTRQQEPGAYVKMLTRIREFSSTIVGENMELMEKILQESNAFKDGQEAKLIITYPSLKE